MDRRRGLPTGRTRHRRGPPQEAAERSRGPSPALPVWSRSPLGLGYVRRAPIPLRQLRATIELPAGFQVDGWGASLALSPGGRFLALAGAGADGKTTAPLARRLTARTCRPSPERKEPRTPSGPPTRSRSRSSPEGKLRRIEVAGGALQTICDAPAGRGGTWAPDGTIVFAPAPFGSLSRVLASGGAVSDAEPAVGNGESDRLPHFLPDGKRVLFLRAKPLASLYDGVYASISRHERSNLVAHEQSEGRYVAPGYLAFVRERNLMVQPFDAESLKTSGEPVAVARQQRFNELRGTAQYSFEGEEILVYQMDPPTRPKQLAWLGLDGKKISAIGDPDPAAIVEISVAPDGKRTVATIDGSGWVAALDDRPRAWCSQSIHLWPEGGAEPALVAGRQASRVRGTRHRQGRLEYPTQGRRRGRSREGSFRRPGLRNAVRLVSERPGSRVQHAVQRHEEMGDRDSCVEGRPPDAVSRKAPPTSLAPLFRPTAAGWRTPRTNRVGMSST